MVERRPINNTPPKNFTRDSFQNLAASLGYGAQNVSSGATYGFNPISRNHTLLEWMYRGSWLVKVIVDAVADDMTREGISLETDMSPDDMSQFERYLDKKCVWQEINKTIKWSRLYGGCIAVLDIAGQKLNTPLRLDTVGKDQFNGLNVLDRWLLWPHLEDIVTDTGPHWGLPKYYDVVADVRAFKRGQKIHYSRIIRLEGVDLPYWQKMAENLWGLSVLEPLYDRLLAFDSTTQGAAQLVYKAHLRTYKIEKLRDLISAGGEMYQAVLAQVQMTRLMQTNEGMTLLDSTDEFETHQYSFGGLSDVMVQFAQQLSGAAQIPLVRLFGQSPAGLNATGDADIRNYYDHINAQQEARLRLPISLVLDVAHRSFFGRPPPEDWDFNFNPLWQMTDAEKAQIALQITQAVSVAHQDGIINTPLALKELKQSSKDTGIWSNISDEEISEAEDMLPSIGEQGLQEQQNEQMAAMKPAAGPGGLTGSGAAGGASKASETPRPNPVAQVMKSKQDVNHHFGKDEELLPAGGNESDEYHLKPDENSPLILRGVTDKQAFSKDHEIDISLIDCAIGPDRESNAVWIVQLQDPDTQQVGDFKAVLGTTDRDRALDTFINSYTDGRGLERIGSIKRTNVDGLREFIREIRGDMSYVNGAQPSTR